MNRTANKSRRTHSNRSRVSPVAKNRKEVCLKTHNFRRFRWTKRNATWLSELLSVTHLLKTENLGERGSRESSASLDRERSEFENRLKSRTVLWVRIADWRGPKRSSSGADHRWRSTRYESWWPVESSLIGLYRPTFWFRSRNCFLLFLGTLKPSFPKMAASRSD